MHSMATTTKKRIMVSLLVGGDGRSARTELHGGGDEHGDEEEDGQRGERDAHRARGGVGCGLLAGEEPVAHRGSSGEQVVTDARARVVGQSDDVGDLLQLRDAGTAREPLEGPPGPETSRRIDREPIRRAVGLFLTGLGIGGDRPGR